MPASTELIVYKDAGCGCCKLWVEHMNTAGFPVTAHDVSDISAVKRGATETGSAAAQVLASAQELARHSSELGSEVDAFLNAVKAA